MSKKISPGRISAPYTEPKMESSLSPDAMSEQLFTIEDALLQASQELPNVAPNSNQATSSKETTDQEDDFVYVEKPKKVPTPHLPTYPEHVPQEAETKPPTLLNNPENIQQDAETKPPTLLDNPENIQQDADKKPPSSIDDPENITHDAETKISTLLNAPEHVPHDAETICPTLLNDPENITHDVETKTLTLLNDPELVPNNAETRPPPSIDDLVNITPDVETKAPTLLDDPKHVPHDVEIQTQSLSYNIKRMSSNKTPLTSDSNADSSGFKSKHKIFGGVLVGAAIVAAGVVIYTYFKSPPKATN